ncbi:hypothetical protein ACQPYK_29825 [Streptosporangium sp. CA-135522]
MAPYAAPETADVFDLDAQIETVPMQEAAWPTSSCICPSAFPSTCASRCC